MSNTALYIEMIENALRGSLPELSEETKHINEMLMYSLESGGKRVRGKSPRRRRGKPAWRER